MRLLEMEPSARVSDQPILAKHPQRYRLVHLGWLRGRVTGRSAFPAVENDVCSWIARALVRAGRGWLCGYVLRRPKGRKSASPVYSLWTRRSNARRPWRAVPLLTGTMNLHHPVRHLSGDERRRRGLCMRCAECGTETAEATRYCPVCGAPVAKQRSVPAEPTADELAAAIATRQQVPLAGQET